MADKDATIPGAMLTLPGIGCMLEYQQNKTSTAFNKRRIGRGREHFCLGEGSAYLKRLRILASKTEVVDFLFPAIKIVNSLGPSAWTMGQLTVCPEAA